MLNIKNSHCINVGSAALTLIGPLIVSKITGREILKIDGNGITLKPATPK
jgi:hypothetical protein